MTARWGFDTTEALDPVNALNLGWAFAMRYLSPAPNPKNLTAPEAKADLEAGMDIGPNWELNTDDALRGFDVGKRFATIATQELIDAGCPQTNQDGTGIAIYYSCDTHATADQVRPFYQGANSVGHFLVGGYGGSLSMKPLLLEGTIHYWWMANAGDWSGFGNSDFPTDPLACIRQFVGTPAGAPASPGTIDVDIQAHDECGFWKAARNQGVTDLTPEQAVQLNACFQSLTNTDAYRDPHGKPMDLHWAVAYCLSGINELLSIEQQKKVADQVDASRAAVSTAPPAPA